MLNPPTFGVGDGNNLGVDAAVAPAAAERVRVRPTGGTLMAERAGAGVVEAEAHANFTGDPKRFVSRS